ncbi:MAG TPA: hypothetical protein VKA60_16820 [Blastocatellia bacterium]|nr:hypothetical protein [Blastocatellia bacterium]
MRPTLLSHSLAANACHRLFQLLISLTITLAVSAVAVAQGFGFFKTEGRLVRRHPPGVYLPVAPLVAQVESPRADAQPILPRLRIGLERALNPPNRQSLTSASTVRTLRLTCTITRINASSHTEMRTRSEYKKTGEHTETDPTTNETRTVDDYGTVSEDYWVTVSDGEMRSEIEIRDAETGLLFDKTAADADYHNESEAQSPLPASVIYDYLADRLIGRLAWRYQPGTDSVRVLLPKGKLKDASRQLEEGRWNMALELLRAAAEFTNPHDDAFRLYGFGLAYEGLAYEQNEAGVTVVLLRRAAQAYADAAQRKRDEGRFIEARLRALASAAEFTAFLNRAGDFEAARKQALLAQGKAPTAAADQPATATTPPATTAGTQGTPRVPLYKGVGKLTNKIIVRWIKAGVPEDEIVTNITQSRANDFDLSPAELARLKQAGVSDQVLLAMQGHQTPRQPGRTGRLVFGTALLVLQVLPYFLAF